MIRSKELWNLTTRQGLATLTGHSAAVKSLAVFANADAGELCLASGSYDYTIKVWSLKTHRELQTLTGHTSGVRSLAVFAGAEDGEHCLASGSQDGTIALWTE